MKVAENRAASSALPFEEGTVTMTVDTLNALLRIAANETNLSSIENMLADVYGNVKTETLCEYDLFVIIDHYSL